MFEDLERDTAHGAMANTCEHGIAQFVEQRTGQSQHAIDQQQGKRQYQVAVLAGIQAVDDIFQHQRHTDIGNLGQDQESQCHQHPATVIPQKRGQCP